MIDSAPGPITDAISAQWITGSIQKGIQKLMAKKVF